MHVLEPDVCKIKMAKTVRFLGYFYCIADLLLPVCWTELNFQLKQVERKMTFLVS